MTSQTNLRHLIREMLLKEEVYGAQATVYHGTEADPIELVDAILSDTFRAGSGSGSHYGKGLYTVHMLERSSTERGNYGPYILKLKVNLYGYIIFDPDTTTKVYGRPLTPAEQAAEVGLSDAAISSLKQYTPPVGMITHPGALWASKFLASEAKGIAYTAYGIGRCVVVYDASTAIPMAWKKLPIAPSTRPSKEVANAPYNTWISVTRDESGEFRPEIRAAGRRSASGEHESGKYDLSDEDI